MAYKATVYKVMIASPRDVVSERSIVRDVLTEWNIINADSRKTILLPVGWETHVSPAMGNRPQAIVNKQILEDCDLLVGVFWTRLGTPTDDYASGTVEEIEEHIKSGKPVMLYFSAAPVVIGSVDLVQYEELMKFKEACKATGIFETYVDLNDFRTKFYRQLQLKLNQDNYFKHETITPNDGALEVVESPLHDMPKLSREAQVLLKEASQDSSGSILRHSSFGGIFIQTHGKQMTEDNNPRNRAVWESAIKELENAGLIVDQGHKGEVFGLTRTGYELAELLNP